MVTHIYNPCYSRLIQKNGEANLSNSARPTQKQRVQEYSSVLELLLEALGLISSPTNLGWKIEPFTDRDHFMWFLSYEWCWVLKVRLWKQNSILLIASNLLQSISVRHSSSIFPVEIWTEAVSSLSREYGKTWRPSLDSACMLCIFSSNYLHKYWAICFSKKPWIISLIFISKLYISIIFLAALWGRKEGLCYSKLRIMKLRLSDLIQVSDGSCINTSTLKIYRYEWQLPRTVVLVLFVASERIYVISRSLV